MGEAWRTYFETQLSEIIDELHRYVTIESPTHNKESVDEMGKLIASRFAQLGCTVQQIPQAEVGDIIRAEWGHGEEQILIIGHFDTVKPIGTIQKQPWRIDGDKIYGPGIFDMKAGIVFCYFALKAIIEKGLLPNKRIVFIWNTDEEIGSPFSVDTIKKEAIKSSVALVMEPAYLTNLKTSRKGGGEFRIRAFGHSVHAGNDHEKGINAIEELAEQILKVQRFTDYAAGTTVSVGLIEGGSAVNVVPDYAQVRIDVRAKTAIEANKLTEQMHSLIPVLNGSRIEVEGGFDKLPMERTDGTIHLFHLAEKIASEEGFPIGEASVGGMSDGNTTSSLGVPTLDGLGAVGDGAHADHEHILIPHIPNRIALIIRLLLEL
jgi:glutamate carboxypeptidase